TSIGNLNSIDSQIVVKKWKLLGPFLEPNNTKWNTTSADSELELFENFKPYSGARYSDSFIWLDGKNNTAVNATVNSNTKIYDFGDTASFTIEIKVRQGAGSLYKWPAIFSKRVTFEKGVPGWAIFLDNGSWQINFGQKNKTNFQVSGSKINDGAWHSLVVVCKNKGNRRTIQTFTDGILKSEADFPDDFGSLNSPAPLTLGFVAGGNSEKNPASIVVSDVRLWKCALPEKIRKELVKLHSLNKTNPFYKNLLGSWQCTDGSQAFFKDESSNRISFSIKGHYKWEKMDNPLCPVTTSVDISAVNSFLNQKTDYIDFGEYFRVNGEASAYASAVIN
ncbi:MAG: DUF4983 domain-containing protein, partial [Chitinophagaceae bacterium]